MNKNISITELSYKKGQPLDHLSVSDGILLMANEQKKAAIEVRKAYKSIEFAINQIYDRLILSASGRLVYTGAGTSGRVGVQDGVELFPTFNWPKIRLDFILAGGNKSILNAVENAEDDVLEAKKNTSNKSINSEDVVIGLAASGNTPFSLEVMRLASLSNSLTIAISNNPLGLIMNEADYSIILNTGPEVILGSTRLKAGTAQKICLNMISSYVMIKFGRVKNGEMTHLIASNDKLKLRKKRMLSKFRK